MSLSPEINTTISQRRHHTHHNLPMFSSPALHFLLKSSHPSGSSPRLSTCLTSLALSSPSVPLLSLLSSASSEEHFVQVTQLQKCRETQPEKLRHYAKILSSFSAILNPYNTRNKRAGKKKICQQEKERDARRTK